MSTRTEWLLEFQLGGSVHRYATREVTVTDAAGRSYLYRAGLADLSIPIHGLLEEYAVEVLDRRVSWAREVARGGGIDLRPARLRLWTEGTVLERARVILDGQADEAEYADPETPGRLVFTVRELPGSMYPDQGGTVSPETFLFDPDPGTPEQFDPQVSGAVYPVVFGYPGHAEQIYIDTGIAGAIPAVPALMVKYDGTGLPGGSHLMVCVGQTEAAASSGRVKMFDIGDDTDAEFSDAFIGSDLRGRAYTYVEFIPDGAGGAPDPILGHRYYTSWSPVEGGGLTYGGELVRDLTDVLLWALRNSGRRVDLQAQEGERQRLAGYAVDGYLAQRVDTVSWVESQLVKLFPIVRARTSRGIYFRFVNWWASRIDSIAHLDTSHGARRVSSARVVRDQIVNQFTLHYAIDASTGGPFSTRIMGPRNGAIVTRSTPTDPFQAADPWYVVEILDSRVVGNGLCAASLARFGPRDAAPVTSAYVWSDAQATQILSHWATRDALPRRFLSYTAPMADVTSLQQADVVTVSDDELGLDRAVALVDRVELGTGRLARVDIEVLDQAFRSAE